MELSWVGSEATSDNGLCGAWYVNMASWLPHYARYASYTTDDAVT